MILKLATVPSGLRIDRAGQHLSQDEDAPVDYLLKTGPSSRPTGDTRNHTKL